MSYIQDYRMHKASARDLVEKHGSEMVQTFFEELFQKYTNLDMVYIYAYTPGFNDGDPCYHRQCTVVNDGEIRDYAEEYLYDLYEDYDEEDGDLEINVNLSSKSSREIEAEIESVEDLLEEINGTDWFILAKRNSDGTIEMIDGEYDCGY